MALCPSGLASWERVKEGFMLTSCCWDSWVWEQESSGAKSFDSQVEAVFSSCAGWSWFIDNCELAPHTTFRLFPKILGATHDSKGVSSEYTVPGARLSTAPTAGIVVPHWDCE